MKNVGADERDRIVSRIAGYSKEERKEILEVAILQYYRVIYDITSYYFICSFKMWRCYNITSVINSTLYVHQYQLAQSVYCQMLKEPVQPATSCTNCENHPSNTYNLDQAAKSVRGECVNVKLDSDGKAFMDILSNTNLKNISSGRIRTASIGTQVDFDVPEKQYPELKMRNSNYRKRGVTSRETTPENYPTRSTTAELTARSKRAMNRECKRNDSALDSRSRPSTSRRVGHKSKNDSRELRRENYSRFKENIRRRSRSPLSRSKERKSRDSRDLYHKNDSSSRERRKSPAHSTSKYNVNKDRKRLYSPERANQFSSDKKFSKEDDRKKSYSHERRSRLSPENKSPKRSLRTRKYGYNDNKDYGKPLKRSSQPISNEMGHFSRSSSKENHDQYHQRESSVAKKMQNDEENMF